MRRAEGRHPGGACKRKGALKALLALTAVVLLLAALYSGGREIEARTGRQEVRGNLQEMTNINPRITYEGVVYEPKKLTTMLLMGIDKNSSAGASGFRNGGQADFLLLLLIDHENKTVTPLQIDRDTMAEITVLGVMGNDAGTRDAQICLSHGFGDGNAQSCRLTQQAVSNLLLGVGIDYYVALDLDGIGILNDAVGGVTVVLKDDLSALDPAMRKGATLTLQGKQAEYYVRNRWGIGSGTNEQRMGRQRVYMKALREALNAKFHDDHSFLDKLYDALEPYLQTDMKRGRMINEVWNTRDYAYSETVQPEGQHSVGSDGFMEFHADEAALQKLVVDLFYHAVR